MPEQFILIPGRSSRQGVTLNEGKYTDGYIEEINTLRMHPDDMQRLQLNDGDQVRIWNDIGDISVPCVDAGDECPQGLIFICYGDQSSRLMGGETHGSGMPDSKGLDVFVENPAHPSAEPEPSTDVSATQPEVVSEEPVTSQAEPVDETPQPQMPAEADHDDAPHGTTEPPASEEYTPAPVPHVFVVLVVLIGLLWFFMTLLR